MKLRWTRSPVFQDLAAAVDPLVSPHLDRLAATLPETLDIEPGDGLSDWWCPRGPGGIALDTRLASGPALLPEAADLAARGLGALAMDRWRLAVGSLLEAALWAAEAHGPVPLGRLADQVHTMAPELGWGWEPALDLIHNPEQGLAPTRRSWMWWRRWCAQSGAAPDAPTATQLRAFWTWVRDASRGLRAVLPAHVELPAPRSPRSLPPELGPLGAVAVGGPAGVALEGSVTPRELRLGRDQPPVLVVALERTPLHATALAPGPVGTWSLDSGSVGAQIGAARGVSLALHADGSAELVAADAWLGMVAGPALDDAQRHGVSGGSTGTWELLRVDPEGRSGTLRISGLHRGSATLHNRGGGGFAMPDGPRIQAVRAFLEAVSGTELAWRREHSGGLELRLSAPWPLVLRFSPETSA